MKLTNFLLTVICVILAICSIHLMNISLHLDSIIDILLASTIFSIV